MAFLDKKERVFDIVLTDKGRELLSQNQLEFSYYAFSDEGVDYSGSIDVVSKTTGTLDDFIVRNLSTEADQRRDNTKNKTLNSWLFTMPPRSPTVPEAKISLTGSFTLARRYRLDKVNKILKPEIKEKPPLDVIAVAIAPKPGLVVNKEINHVFSQKLLVDLAKNVETAAKKDPKAFLTEEVKKLISEIKQKQLLKLSNPAFAFQAFQLKKKYTELTGRNYDEDIKNKII